MTTRTWQSDARELCQEIGDRYGIGIGGVSRCVVNALDADDTDSALGHLERLAIELGGAWSLATVTAPRLCDEINAHVHRAHDSAHAGRMQRIDPNWAAEECEAVQSGGILEHLKDAREPEATP